MFTSDSYSDSILNLSAQLTLRVKLIMSNSCQTHIQIHSLCHIHIQLPEGLHVQLMDSYLLGLQHLRSAPGAFGSYEVYDMYQQCSDCTLICHWLAKSLAVFQSAIRPSPSITTSEQWCAIPPLLSGMSISGGHMLKAATSP